MSIRRNNTTTRCAPTLIPNQPASNDALASRKASGTVKIVGVLFLSFGLLNMMFISSLSSDATRVLDAHPLSSVNQHEQDALPNDTSILWSPSRLHGTASLLSRPFPKHSQWLTHQGYTRVESGNKSIPLYNTPPTGLLYVKVPKSASSTIAAVVRRISRSHDGSDFQNEHTGIRGAEMHYANRDSEKSFLVGSVRDPAKRAVSRLFFHFVSLKGGKPTDENLLKWLSNSHYQFGCTSAGQGGFQLRYMLLQSIPAYSAWNKEKPTEIANATQIHHHVEQIINQYNFMVVVERMDESMVVLQMLLGVEIGDMITLDSKAQGAYTYNGKKCFLNQKASLSPRVKEYLLSDTWFAQNYGDYLLHAAANASLDKTIEMLGRKKVEKGVVEYRRLKAMAHDKCASKAFFPCSRDGEMQVRKSRQSCYYSDEGCGYRCIDDMLQSEAASQL